MIISLSPIVFISFPNKKSPHMRTMAEKEGFEPSHPLSRSTPLAGEPLQPLGYFSKSYLTIVAPVGKFFKLYIPLYRLGVKMMCISFCPHRLLPLPCRLQKLLCLLRLLSTWFSLLPLTPCRTFSFLSKRHKLLLLFSLRLTKA